MKHKLVAFLFVVALAYGSAFGSSGTDALKVNVSNWSGSPLVILNGNQYAVGTYALGTIQLFYTVKDYQFTTGYFGQFTVNLAINPAAGTSKTDYPLNVNLHQTGSQNLVVTPEPDSFAVGDNTFTGTSTVTINIPEGVSNADGTELVANLQFGASKTSPGSPQLDTPTTVQVHIKLVHPTACLRLFNFMTSQDFSSAVNNADLKINKKSGYVVSMTYGQWSDNVLLVNTCAEAKSFDLSIVLDPRFDTSPSGNPGNAVFTYLASSQVDPDAFDLSLFPSGTKQGENLCLVGLNVPAGDTFLATAHIDIIRQMVWNFGTWGATGTFSFSAQVNTPGTGCTAGTPHPDVQLPNPATLSVTYNAAI